MLKFTEVIKKLVFDAAPCEISSIYELLLTITDNKNGDIILDVLGQYNVQKRIPIDLDGSLTLITEYNKSGSKFFDPIRGLAFSVDNLRNKAIDVEQYEADVNEKQKALNEQLQTYVKSTFPAESTCAVLPNGTEDELVLIIVSTKFSPDNYWSGYWKSEYTYNTSTRALKGNITVSAHYYEDGNVTFHYPGNIDEENISDVVKALQRLESSFENNLDQSFKKVNETQFVKLRRRLPVTRSKINWGKAIGGYRLGKDAAKGK